MKVKQVMTTRVVTVSMDDRIPAMQEILLKGKFHHLLVVEDEQLQGVISESDLLRVMSPYLGTEVESKRDIETSLRRAHQVMTRSPITVSPDTSVKEALKLMLTHNIGCLPVLDGIAVVGIFTINDGVRVLIDTI